RGATRHEHRSRLQYFAALVSFHVASKISAPSAGSLAGLAMVRDERFKRNVKLLVRDLIARRKIARRSVGKPSAGSRPRTRRGELAMLVAKVGTGRAVGMPGPLVAMQTVVDVRCFGLARRVRARRP